MGHGFVGAPSIDQVTAQAVPTLHARAPNQSEGAAEGVAVKGAKEMDLLRSKR